MENKQLSNYQTSPVLIFAALFIIIAGLMSAVSFINAILMGLFISIVCAQPIDWLRNKKVPKSIALLIVLVGITLIFFFVIEVIGSSLSSFSKNATFYEENLKEMGSTILNSLNNRGLNVSFSKISDLIDISKAMNITASLLGRLGSLMGNALTIFFLTVFLLLEMDSISIKAKLGFKNSGDMYLYVNSIVRNIRHYLTIKTITSLLTGFFVWICLIIIGVDYAILWALIAFLLNYIPNFGSIIAAIPAMLFALIQLGYHGAFWTTMTFITVNMIIGNMVEPKMMGKGLGLSTYIVFLSLLFWGFILGTAGMFLSVPLTMAMKIILDQNPKTKWISIFLGTEEEAREMLKNKEEIG